MEQLSPGRTIAVTVAVEPRLTGDVNDVMEGIALKAGLGVASGSGVGGRIGWPEGVTAAGLTIGSVAVGAGIVCVGVGVGSSGGGAGGLLGGEGKSGASVGTARPPVVGSVVETAVVGRGSGSLSLEQATIRVTTKEAVTTAASR